jgi:MtN3 and saliva related transmembrane protein
LSIELIGWAAVILTQVFWIPNISRILKTRDVQGYSLPAWIIMVTGLSCWLIYFLVRGDIVGIVANIFGVAGAATTTACIWVWRRSPARLVEAGIVPAAATPD